MLVPNFVLLLSHQSGRPTPFMKLCCSNLPTSAVADNPTSKRALDETISAWWTKRKHLHGLWSSVSAWSTHIVCLWQSASTVDVLTTDQHVSRSHFLWGQSISSGTSSLGMQQALAYLPYSPTILIEFTLIIFAALRLPLCVAQAVVCWPQVNYCWYDWFWPFSSCQR